MTNDTVEVVTTPGRVMTMTTLLLANAAVGLAAVAAILRGPR